MKKLLAVFLIVVMLAATSVAVFASPETIPSDVSGTTSDLIMVTKPENQKGSTFNSSYIISGYGMGGTVVTLYSYNAADDVFEKVYNTSEYVDANGGAQVVQTGAEVTIGTSGLFMGTVGLSQGENIILVRAENGDHVQFMKLSLTKFNYNIIDLIKSMSA